MGATGLHAEPEFILAVAVVVATFGNRVPAVAGLEHGTDLAARFGEGEERLPFFLGGHVEAVEAGLLGVLEVVEAAPVVALVAYGTFEGADVHVLCSPELRADADPLVGVTVAGVPSGS